MGSRILVAQYFDDEGLSLVMKSGRWGTFSDAAMVADEDRDVASEFTGCSFAEYKCDARAQHEKAKYYRARYEGIDMAYKNLKQSIPTSDQTMIALHRQRGIAKRDYEREMERYRKMRSMYKDYTSSVIRSRKELLGKINREVSA